VVAGGAGVRAERLSRWSSVRLAALAERGEHSLPQGMGERFQRLAVPGDPAGLRHDPEASSMNCAETLCNSTVSVIPAVTKASLALLDACSTSSPPGPVVVCAVPELSLAALRVALPVQSVR
jgi:hypothetical protein